MGEMGVWVEKEKTLLQKKELNPEIWGKGVCDIWEKWVCLGGEIEYLGHVRAEFVRSRQTVEETQVVLEKDTL